MRGLLVFLTFMTVAACALAEDLRVIPAREGAAASGNMMKAYLQRLAEDARAQRAAAYEALDTPEEIAAYQARPSVRLRG